MQTISAAKLQSSAKSSLFSHKQHMDDIRNLVNNLIDLYKKRNFTLSFAESCTGGLCASSVVSAPGASDILCGSVVSYANSAKEKLLFVPKDVLETYGAVSSECATLMAQGARKQFETDIAISVTGIAGPGGGTKDKPVGLVYIGVASARGSYAKKLLLSDVGDRTAIREHSVCEMLKMAIEELQLI